MKAKYPEYNQDFNFDEAKNMDDIIELIKKVRKLKLENNIKDIYLKYNNAILTENKDIIDKLLKVKTTDNYNDLDTFEINFRDSLVYLYYDGNANKTAEIESLYREKERLEASIERREKLLSNENYVNKAPKNIVDNEKNQLEKEKKDLEIIIKKLL